MRETSPGRTAPSPTRAQESEPTARAVGSDSWALVGDGAVRPGEVSLTAIVEASTLRDLSAAVEDLVSAARSAEIVGLSVSGKKQVGRRVARLRAFRSSLVGLLARVALTFDAVEEVYRNGWLLAEDGSYILNEDGTHISVGEVF